MAECQKSRGRMKSYNRVQVLDNKEEVNIPEGTGSRLPDTHR